MASQTFTSTSLSGSQVPSRPSLAPARRPQRNVTVAGVSKKVNTYDDSWAKVRHLRLATRKHSSAN